jgi:LysM repeat protein
MKNRLFAVLMAVALLLAGLCLPIPVHAADPFCHIVKPGENITEIARLYGVTVAEILEINNLWNPNIIYPGQCLLIPRSSPDCGFYHTVKRGEYLKLIAARYSVSVSAIVQANRLRNPNLIYPGQRLWIPCTTPTPPPQPPCVRIHIVKRGEYLKLIAARYGVSVSAIVRANGLRNPNLIYPGQRLKISVPCDGTPSPPPPSGPWMGRYWNNRDLSGNPTFTRNEAKIDFSWGRGSPDRRIGNDNFSIRWTRTRQFDAGMYRFQITVDDGVRLWVDDILVIDEWHDTAPRTYTVDRHLSAGNHRLRIDYYEHTGGAKIQFTITRTDGPGAWTGQYYNNMTLSGTPVLTRHDNAIHFNWGNRSPAAGVTADLFSARWTGEFNFPGGRVRFTATSDDGIRIYLDGTLILNEWHDTSARTYNVDVDVSAGLHQLKVEYYEHMGGAVAKVGWAQQ